VTTPCGEMTANGPSGVPLGRGIGGVN